MKFKTYNLDCRDVMDMYIPENSVDSIVTDPPYELSKDGKQSPNRVFLKFAFPQNPKIESYCFGGDCLSDFIGEIFSLSGVGSVPSPTTSVPVIPVALNDDVSFGEHDVINATERTVGVAQIGTRSNIETEANKYLGSFTLKLTDTTKIFQILNELGTGFYSGAIGVGFGELTSSFPSVKHSGTSINDSYKNVGGTNDTLTHLVSTLTGATSGPMFSFQLAGCSNENLTADGARLLAAVLLFSGAQLIRTRPAASGLSPVFESRRISVVNDTTDRAISFDLLVHTQSIASSGFMGKDWDGSKAAYDVSIWESAFRVLKPGGHLLAFGGPRTYHRLTCAIEDAGFEIRDSVMWMFGSGFPKSLDVSKAIDKAAGAEREVIRTEQKYGVTTAKDGKQAYGDYAGEWDVTAPSTELAQQWDGWGTALKPAYEPVVVARKPLIGTVVQNVLAHGVGGLNIDGCRVPAPEGKTSGGRGASNGAVGWKPSSGFDIDDGSGRWPANLIHDGSEEVVALFPTNTSTPTGGTSSDRVVGTSTDIHGTRSLVGYSDSGSAARFFYVPKASKKDRDEGMGDAPVRVMAMSNQAKAELARGNMPEGDSGMNSARLRQNNHPTVKPTDLMAYLCRLVTPPGGTVLDPFMGSGSTGKAALREGFRFIGCELEAEYHAIADARLKAAV